MKIGIIGSDRKEWHISRLLKGLKAKGAEAYLVPVTKLQARIGGTPKVSVKGFGVDVMKIVPEEDGHLVR